MGLRRFFSIFAIILIIFFGIGGGVAAADSETLDINISTDKESYEYEDEIISTITITNLSDRYYAENLSVETLLPEAFEILDSDVEITEKGKVLWDVETLERGDSVELTFQTKLTQSEIDRLISKENDEEEESSDETNAGDESDDTNDVAIVGDNSDGQDVEGSASEGQGDQLNAPQTGDDTNLLKYVILLVASVGLGIFAMIGLRKKRVPKSVSILLAIALLTPVLTVAHAESEPGQNMQTLTKGHQVVIGNQNYDIETSVTATIEDGQVDIPVTGTAYDENGTVLTNETLIFSANFNDGVVEEIVETDDEGYFVVRLVENALYHVSGNSLESSVLASDVNEIEVTSEIGKIVLGKTLANGDNRASLQPSVIYLGDEDATLVANISNDLTTAKVDHALDIQVEDIFVVPEWEGYPTGIALYVESISYHDGNMILQIRQPEIEEIFTEIVGNMQVDISPEYFVPAEGVTVIDQPESSEPETQLFSAASAIMPLAQVGGSLYLSVDNLVQVEDLSVNGTAEVSGYVYGDIDWRVGFNPFDRVDFNFTGDYQLDLQVVGSKEYDFEATIGKLIVPTQIPVLTVNIPLDFVASVGGEVSIGMKTGSKLNYGIEYQHGSGIRTYPEQHYTPYFDVTDVNGSANVSAGLRLSVLAGLLGVDGFGVAGTGQVKGSATTSIIGSSAFQCLLLNADFNGEARFTAPLFDWESDSSIGFSVPLYEESFGDCISSIKFNPQEIEIGPGETKSVEIIGRSIDGSSNISDDPNIHFEVADESSIEVLAGEHPTKVDIIASESAQNGDVIEVKAVYDLHGTHLTDTLTVKVVDDRPKGDLIGKVANAIDDTPIEGALARVLDGDDVVAHAYTANDGIYHVSLVPGTYVVEVSHEGYITDATKLTITQSDTTTYDAKLELVDNEHAGIGKATGQIQHAVTGQGIAGVNIEIRNGRNNTDGEAIETITTDENGYYFVDLPGGNYTMSLSLEGYIPTVSNILIIGGEEKDNQNATMSPDGVVEENLRIILTWGEYPRDLDSHLTGPTVNGDRFHIYYSNKNFQDEANDVNLDRDDISSYGPETVTVINKMQMGTYVYAVHNYTGRYLDDQNQFDLSNAGAKVEVYQDDTLLASYPVPVDQIGNSWRVFEIRDGQIVPINQMETIDSWRSADNFAPVQ